MNNTKFIEEKILTAELDIGIVEGQVKNHDLINTPAVKDCLVIICGKNHSFAGRSHVAISELNNQSFVMREEGSGTRELFENYLQKHGVNYKIGWEVTCPDVIKKAVMGNDCLAAISVRLVEEEIKSGKLYAINSSEHAWDRSFNIVYYKNKYISDSMKTIMEIVTQYNKPDLLKNIPAGSLVSD